jgi:hypothetical protein
MATIEELGRMHAEVVEKEAEALAGLANYLRNAIVELPAQSRIALDFARMAPRLERVAKRRSDMAHTAFNELSQLLFDAERDEGAGA